jgi:acetolactate decarboxylase
MLKGKFRTIKLSILSLLLITLSGFSSSIDNKDVLFQYSTINALYKGIYDGEMTYKELKRHGNFGLGTFNSLDGEMIGLNGHFYQIKANGVVRPVDDLTKTPFATVTFFEPDKTVLLKNKMNYEQLKQSLDSLLPTKNLFYAIKIEGVFKYIKARSVSRQNKPYPSFTDVINNESIFEFNNIRGTLVGFYYPEYTNEINVPGYHFHFITEDRKAGGHLLECEIQDVKVEIDYISRFYMLLPQCNEFYNMDFTH